ncbi:transcriptional adapter 2B isoform X2 [Lucilia sericata]|uniref:transcriptional adapter 2B isoform X2 n=1 Tax=Lucilia sericata TaxID=13632 RepID=UPI0018A85DB4|nr:transcriptional adapter 2B isoform X2 [Lucilia sericata]
MADLFTKYNCTNCQDDIQGIRVHCAECENFDLCLQCFAAGAEIGAHQNNHAYQFMDTGTAILSVFRGKGAWTAREEIRLLDAIEQYGYGNWEDVSKHIETKSAEDAKEEYVNKFVNGTIGRHTWTPAQAQRPTLIDHTSEDNGPLGATAMQRLPPLDITAEEAAQLGYMPNRDSFEREYDFTAEQLISKMSLNTDDTEADYLLKLAHVDLYTRRLRERVRRKRLVRDYQLVANFFRNRNYAQHPGLSREQKDFRDRFRVFAQFYTANEYERLLNSLEREKELRIRLSELCRYRYNGLTKIDECRHFEQHAAMATNRSTGPYGHGKTDNMHHNTGNHRQPDYSLHSPQHNNRKLEMSNGNENSNSIAPNNMHHTGDQISYVGSSLNRNYLDSYRGSPAHTTMTTTMVTAINSTTTPAAGLLTTQPTTTMMKTQTNANQNQQLHLQQLLTASTKNAPQLQINDIVLTNQNVERLPLIQENINSNPTTQMNSNGQRGQQSTASPAMPMSNILRSQLDELKHLTQPLGMNLLSSNEQQLCKVFNLPPTTYISLKTLFLSGAPVATNNLSPVESSLRKYFIKVGWLSH